MIWTTDNRDKNGREVHEVLDIKGELSTRQIIKLTAPLFLEQIVLLGLPVINSILVSSAGQAALSGVSLVDQINTMLSYLFLYAMCGISIIAAQYFGRRDKENLRHSIRQAFTASNLISLSVMLIVLFFGNFLLDIFMRGADAQIMVEAKNYFKILVFSFPFFSFYSVCVASLRGIGNTRSAMVVSIIQNASSIAFSSVLIYVFHLGVYGAALGMIGGRIVGATIGSILLVRSRAINGFKDMFGLDIDRVMQKKNTDVRLSSKHRGDSFHAGQGHHQHVHSGLRDRPGGGERCRDACQ